MKKTLDFTKVRRAPKEYRRQYVLSSLTAEEMLEIDEECFQASGAPGKFNYKLYSLLLLQKSLVEPKMTLEELRKMPAIPFNILIETARNLNLLTADERRFLLKT